MSNSDNSTPKLPGSGSSPPKVCTPSTTTNTMTSGDATSVLSNGTPPSTTTIKNTTRDDDRKPKLSDYFVNSGLSSEDPLPSKKPMWPENIFNNVATSGPTSGPTSDLALKAPLVPWSPPSTIAKNLTSDVTSNANIVLASSDATSGAILEVPVLTTTSVATSGATSVATSGATSGAVLEGPTLSTEVPISAPSATGGTNLDNTETTTTSEDGGGPPHVLQSKYLDHDTLQLALKNCKSPSDISYWAGPHSRASIPLSEDPELQAAFFMAIFTAGEEERAGKDLRVASRAAKLQLQVIKQGINEAKDLTRLIELHLENLMYEAQQIIENARAMIKEAQGIEAGTNGSAPGALKFPSFILLSDRASPATIARQKEICLGVEQAEDFARCLHKDRRKKMQALQEQVDTWGAEQEEQARQWRHELGLCREVLWACHAWKMDARHKMRRAFAASE